MANDDPQLRTMPLHELYALHRLHTRVGVDADFLDDVSSAINDRIEMIGPMCSECGGLRAGCCE